MAKQKALPTKQKALTAKRKAMPAKRKALTTKRKALAGKRKALAAKRKTLTAKRKAQAVFFAAPRAKGFCRSSGITVARSSRAPPRRQPHFPPRFRTCPEDLAFSTSSAA